jgi:DNA-binding NtrC family response regulator
MERVRRAVEQVAPSRATVLLTGESGTGKELLARAIHEGSPVAGGPFVSLHLGGLPEREQEAEIFGQEGNGTESRPSRLAQARGGSLFLDEIDELSAASQVRLLRVLEESELEPVGGRRTEPIDVRVIAATDKHLEALVRSGRFRQDLFYRLSVVEIRVPPLRERRADIPALAEHFIHYYASQDGKPANQISQAALDLLCRHSWPGNLRELENVVEHAVVLAEGSSIEPAHLPPGLGTTARQEPVPTVPGATIDELERYAILKTLEAVGGSTSKAAEKLGISVRKIQYKLQEYGSSGRGL